LEREGEELSCLADAMRTTAGDGAADAVWRRCWCTASQMTSVASTFQYRSAFFFFLAAACVTTSWSDVDSEECDLGGSGATAFW
jgi:hypothetical protein